MKKWFHVFFKNRWGRGQPDDIGAINLGDEKFDPDSDKKPRAGQILWIRGLTRLQTQVTIPISLFLFLSLLFYILSHSLIILITLNKINILSNPLSRKQNETQQDCRHRIQQVRMASPHETYASLLTLTFRTLSFFHLLYYLSFNFVFSNNARDYSAFILRRTYIR